MEVWWSGGQVKLKAFVHKGHMQHPGPISIPCRIEPVLGRPTRPDMKSIVAQPFSVDLVFVFEKQRVQKTQFSKGIFWRSFVERKTKETFVLLNDEVTEVWYLPLVLSFI